jgi:hypothetical protein
VQSTPSRPLTLTPTSATAVRKEIPWAAWLLLAGGWSLFALWWWVVLEKESLSFLGRALAAVGAGVAAVLVFSLAWVQHNKRLARGGKRGNASAYITRAWNKDALGRTVFFPPADQLKTASVITVQTSGTGKRYQVVEEAPSALSGTRKLAKTEAA